MKRSCSLSAFNRLVHLMLVGVMLAGGIAAYAQADLYRGYEMPPYQVTQSAGEIERRVYQPHLLAEVKVQGDRSSAIGQGFRILAGYIFGDNTEDQKIAMTVPVSQTSASGSETWAVQFMMPSSYTMETLPEAENDAIRFFMAPGEEQLVISFAGRGNDRALQGKIDELRAYADANGLGLIGAPRFYFYDDPFTFPWNRRNEVAFVIE